MVEINPINQIVVLLFTLPDIGLWIGVLIAIGCGFIVLRYRSRRFKPLENLLQRRVEALEIVANAPTEEDAQLRFAEQFDVIDDAMIGDYDNRHGENVRHAWTQYKETLIDETSEVREATARPEDYFLHLGDETRSLSWWANIFVALGLTFTFLGIVAALLQAVVSMNANADPGNMQASLISLLNITAAKFWTSISGVASSIVLRVFDRDYTAKINSRLQLICDRLEYGTLFSPPQRLAALQLEQTKQQTAAITAFSTEIAIAISNAFEEIGSGVGDAIKERAGKEIQGLAESLTELNLEVAGLREELAAMSGAFQDSTESFGEHADRLRSAALSAGIVSDVLDQAAKDIGEVAKPLKETQSVAEQITEKLADLVDNVEAAISVASKEIKTIAEGVDRSNEAARAAWQEYRARFDEIDEAVVAAVEQVANSTRSHADNINTFVGQVDEGMAGAIQRLSGALDRIGDLADDLKELRDTPRKEQ